MMYDLDMPEFLRIIWTSTQAREVWEPRIQAVSRAWQEIERLAVLHSLKPCTLQVCSPEEFIVISQWCAKHGLYCIPVAQEGKVDGYSNSAQAVEPGKPWTYRIIIGSKVVLDLFVEAWRERNDQRIGSLLGFPSCCQDFFERYWVKEGWRDLTFPMVKGEVDARILRVGGPMECNILLRWLGVRLVSHLPCSFYCDATETMGQRFGLLAIRYGYVSEMDWLTQMLNWPVRWSSLHGVATITTPVLKIVTNTTALKEEHQIDRDGTEYPAEGARGTVFPFRQTASLTVRRTNDYGDNGFRSRDAQEKAHALVCRAAMRAFADGAAQLTQKVIDLGCGNGKLLEAILNGASWIRPCGVEADKERYEKAARRLAQHNPDVYHCSIFDEHFWSAPYCLALMSSNRLGEVEPADARKLLAKLRDSCSKVILYSYDTVEWKGVSGLDISEFFALEEHITGDNACAVLLTPKRAHDNHHV
jgi:hypothetical protein